MGAKSTSIEQYLHKKILRHSHIPTMGMFIHRVVRISQHRYSLTVRYMDVSGTLKWGPKDTIAVDKQYIISQFDILENPDDIKSFKDGTWVPLRHIKITIESRGGELI